MTIQCVVVTDGVRCLNAFSSETPFSPNARYICKNHPRAGQVRAAGREYDSVVDEKDSQDRFQSTQFDPTLSGRRKN